MQARKIILWITKFLGKVILGLLLVLFIAVALIHLPPVQKQFTSKVSNYLSSKINARVDIQKIKFSILGNVAIEGLGVWDPHNNKIFSAQKIEVATDVFDLVSGNLIFNEISIEGVDSKLIKDANGLNIQYILNAFRSTEKKTSVKSNPVTLQFKKVHLENILFEFISADNGTSVTVNLGTFTTNDVELVTKPLKIKADEIILERTEVQVLTSEHSATDTVATQTTHKTLSPDFGTRIAFEVKNLMLKDDAFSFHRGHATETKKFDPSHITLKKIQISIADILIHADTLAARLNSLGVQTPGFTLTEVKSAVHMNRDQLFLTEFHLAAGNTNLQADFTAPLNWYTLTGEDHFPLGIELQSQLNPKDFDYFFRDSVIHLFNRWGLTELALEGNYTKGKGKINTLKLKTGNSQLQAEGMVNTIFVPKKIYWESLAVNATIGSDFKTLILPYLKKVKTPPILSLQVVSSGNLDEIQADGKVFSNWGNAKFTGQVIPDEQHVEMDVTLKGEKVDLAEWLSTSSLGQVNVSVNAKGMVGDKQHVGISGLIDDIEIMDQTINDIAFQSTVRNDSASVALAVEDPHYRTKIKSEISFTGPLRFTNMIQLNNFKLGNLLHADSTLIISGNTKSEIVIDNPSLEGSVEGQHMVFQKQSMEYSLDTLVMHALLSPSKSEFSYYTDNAKVELTSSFDMRQASEIVTNWSEDVLSISDESIPSSGNRTAHINMELKNESFLKLLGIDVDDFSSLMITGDFNEQHQTATLQAASGKFQGYGISLDTLNANLVTTRDTITASLNANDLLYNSIHLGNLDFDLQKRGDTSLSNLLLSNDSIVLFGLNSRILRADSGVFVQAEKLLAFDTEYEIDAYAPVFIGSKNVAFNHFRLKNDSMQIKLHGDLDYFDVSLKNIDLTPLNFLISPDTTLISKGHLHGEISYSRDNQLKFLVGVDSLSLYSSNPLTMSASAVTDGNHIPFELRLFRDSNAIDLTGNYFTKNKELDASLLIDVDDLGLFASWVPGVIDKMSGAMRGKATIKGPLKKPSFKGSVRFIDMELTTANPKLTFNVQDDSVALTQSSVVFDQFTLFDQEHHPLTISGHIASPDYESFAYDLHLNSEEYTLINNPDSASGKVIGLLVLDSDISLKGNGKDTDVKATLAVKDATNLTFVSSSDDIELLQAEGIVAFIDPAVRQDSVTQDQSINLYDSLIASLPAFNLNSTITIEDQAALRILIDEQSGDYIEASGSANLELNYDRTGNLNLAGNYTVNKGVYRLSFYDLVKRDFKLVMGSSVNWGGSPKNGDLNIKAVHTVESNSLGLIGQEIGENEKSIYKRSLDYEVGINIQGTIDKPAISFSLDLPQKEKVNYPVLANKLDRLRQPEYASELNKQVFGLLVLGGFLPESNSSDVNSSAIATTALYNSVNSLLASQLNRFASQHVKGVNIDVGIQSYSDYSAPGSKTQTAMDFRVSKSIMNDRLSFEIGGDFDINQDQSGANTGTKNYRGDVAIIYDLTGNGDKKLKLFNNETYDIIYQEIRNTGISIIFIREFDNEKDKKK